MDKRQLKEAILKRIEKPVIPSSGVFCSAVWCGTRQRSGSRRKYCRKRLIRFTRKAEADLCFLPGRYRTGALQLKNGVELHLQSKDTVLAFVSEEPEVHYPVVFSHWEATPCYNFSPLIYACDAHDIAVTGTGTLDGKGRPGPLVGLASSGGKCMVCVSRTCS